VPLLANLAAVWTSVLKLFVVPIVCIKVFGLMIEVKQMNKFYRNICDLVITIAFCVANVVYAQPVFN